MPRRSTLSATLLLSALLARPVAAQDAAVFLEIQAAAAIPIGDFAEGASIGEGAEPGPSFGVAFAVRRTDHLALVLGFDQHRFDCASAGCSSSGTFVATGFDVGLRLAMRSSGSIVPWIRASAITTRVETPDLAPPDDGVSALGWGFEAGAGVWIGSDVIGLSPAATYSAVDTDLPGGSTLGLRYLTAGLTLTLLF